MHWYTDVLKKYAVFDGRAGRPEFWWFVLINAIIEAIIYGVALAAGSSAIFFLAYIYGLAVFLPSLGVGIRRLHDTNRSGWWILIDFVPIVGGIVLIVLWALA
ncbi:MAG TPA: DUF805 domain-containing protein, partial [Gaiellales bacterium]|nr:DUF805 domain-containing protein [Gaiellales bacterium]